MVAQTVYAFQNLYIGFLTIFTNDELYDNTSLNVVFQSSLRILQVVTDIFQQLGVTTRELWHLLYSVINLLFFLFYRFLNDFTDISDIFTMNVIGTFDISDRDRSFVEVQIFLSLHLILFAHLFDAYYKGMLRRLSACTPDQHPVSHAEALRIAHLCDTLDAASETFHDARKALAACLLTEPPGPEADWARLCAEWEPLGRAAEAGLDLKPLAALTDLAAERETFAALAERLGDCAGRLAEPLAQTAPAFDAAFGTAFCKKEGESACGDGCSSKHSCKKKRKAAVDRSIGIQNQGKQR